VFVLGGLWLHPVSFFLTGLIMIIGTQYEYYKIVSKAGLRPQVYAGIILAVSVYILSTLIASGIIPFFYFIILIPELTIIMIIELFRKHEKPFDSLAHTFFAVLYTAIPFSMFPFAAYSKDGLHSLIPNNFLFSPGIVIGFFLLIWANDTGAYISGVSFGHHKLMERISPKKTWEGFIGGFILTALTAWLLSEWLGVVSRFNWIIISVIITFIGTLGDLIESMLKRSEGVKDSGTILPGHGGFLDRFDSAILAFPVVYLFILLFG
jgi:phosphatidate cytidylyltransferase